MKRQPRTSRFTSNLTYERLEPKNLLAGDILVGNLNSGVAVSDNATGAGHIMYSEVDVHSRFSGVPATNADHFIATRLDGLQWQYNNDSNWVDFTPVASDLLVAEVNFDGDSVARIEVGEQNVNYYRYYGRSYPHIVQGVEAGYIGDDIRFAANRFGDAIDEGEFQVLGSSFSRTGHFDSLTPSEKKLTQLGFATNRYESVHRNFPRAASVDDSGAPLLSWRVHILPFLGLDNLYDQFNLEEPWDSATNLAAAAQMPDVYSSPHFSSATNTSFLALTGSGTMFPAFGPLVTFGSVTDGSSNTALFVEADADRSVFWTQPADIAFDPAIPLDGLGSISADGFAVVTAAREAFTVPATIDPQNFANMGLRNDGNFVDFSDVAPYTSSKDSLRQIALASHNYESAHMHFPAHAIYSEDGTTPLLSWRVTILPFMDQYDLFNQFHLDEPWDSPHNLSLLPLMPRIYAHPEVDNGMTNYLGVSGPGTIFEFSDTSFNFGHITDGSANTVMFVEADLDFAVEWTKPADWFGDQPSSQTGLGGLLPDGFNVAFADGSHRFVSNQTTDTNFAKMLTRSGGEVADFSTLSNNYTPSKSLSSLALASLNYESAYMHYPQYANFDSNGSPLLSWRVNILPFIEQGALYNMFHHDEPWDSPHNLSLLPLMPEIYMSEGIANGMTVFQGVNGPGTMFPLEDINISPGSVSDGPMNTALFLEVDADRAIEWTRPMDLPFDPTDPGDGLGNASVSGFHFVTGDGAAHYYTNALDREPLEYLLQRNDGVPFFAEYDSHHTSVNNHVATMNKLRQLSLSAHNYESAHMRLPGHAIYSPPTSSGTPMLSWRVAILPFLGHDDLYDEFNLDEPWDSPHNLSLLPLMPREFSHPMVENGMTVFQGITTPFNTGDPESIFPINYRGVTFGQITDGSSNTILFVESNIDQAVEWTKPQDLMFDPANPTAGLGEAHFNIGNHIVLGDGSTHFLANCTAPEFVSNYILRNDGNVSSGIYDGCEDSAAAVVAGGGIQYAGGIEATDKEFLLPGQTATFKNYSSYIHGITSLSLDIGRLGDPDAVSADDFIFRVGNGNSFSDFTTIGLTPTVTVAAQAGESESDRVTLEFPAGLIKNTWLQVTVLANDNTGLETGNVFYFGNAVGETGNSTTDARVNLVDVGLTRSSQTGFTPATVENPYDFNRDTRVNLVDVGLVRANQSGFTSLNLITAPGSSNRSSDSGAGSDTKSDDSLKNNFRNSDFTSFASFAVDSENFKDELNVRDEKADKGDNASQRMSLSGAIERGSIAKLLESEFKPVDFESFEFDDIADIDSLPLELKLADQL